MVATQIFFYFHPENWGRWTHFALYFSSWVGSTTNMTTDSQQHRNHRIRGLQPFDPSSALFLCCCWACCCLSFFQTVWSVLQPKGLENAGFCSLFCYQKTDAQCSSTPEFARNPKKSMLLRLNAKAEAPSEFRAVLVEKAQVRNGKTLGNWEEEL